MNRLILYNYMISKKKTFDMIVNGMNKVEWINNAIAVESERADKRPRLREYLSRLL